jgi:hypothetical protein
MPIFCCQNHRDSEDLPSSIVLIVPHHFLTLTEMRSGFLKTPSVPFLLCGLFLISHNVCPAQDILKKKNQPQFVAMMDQSNSFRGIVFGTSIDEVQRTIDLDLVTEETTKTDPLKLYIRAEEKKSLGNVAIQEVIYYFLEGKFYAVSIATLDIRQTENLRKALEIVYGALPQIDKESRAAVWTGKNTTAFMRFNQITGEARTLISNNDLQKNYDRTMLESAKKAALEL